MEIMRGEVEEILGKTTATTPEDRIRAQHHRVRRGLLLYETCSSEELQVFCQQRGLNPPRRSYRITRRARDELIKLLESADEDITFHKYDDLPPELGLLVIEAYMSSTRASPQGDAPPPICGVSRAIRHECLYIFYEDYRLRLSFDLERASPDLSTRSRDAMSKLRVSEVEYIKKYTIAGLFGFRNSSTATLDIAKDGTSYQLSERSGTVSDRQRRIAAKMLGRLKDSLDGMLAKDGKIVLSASKIWGWLGMWSVALREVEVEDGIEHPRSLSGPPAPPILVGALSFPTMVA